MQRKMIKKYAFYVKYFICFEFKSFTNAGNGGFARFSHF